MKKYLLLIVSVVTLVSCGKPRKFPVSSVVPAADMEIKTSIDRNDNTIIEFTAENLAAPERVDSAYTAYVFWINTQDNGYKNLGQIVNRNATKVNQTFSSAFKPTQAIITLEKAGNVSIMSDKIISSMELK